MERWHTTVGSVLDSLRWLRRNTKRPRWGNLRRAAPFSDRYGFDRGRPVDRLYIDRFLAVHAERVRGDVLEVLGARYTRRFGGERVLRSHVLDIDPDNPNATIVADLGAEGSLPTASYDCVILTQTLQLIPDVGAALRNVWAALRPGGTLLITVPTASKVEPAYRDLWRWTPDGFEEELRRGIPEATPQVRGHGNLVAMIAHLHGLAVEDLHDADLARDDPVHPLIVTARVDRPPEVTGPA